MCLIVNQFGHIGKQKMATELNSKAESQTDQTMTVDNGVTADQSCSSETNQRLDIRTYKNIVAIGVAFLLQFTAFNGMQNLQSSLNTEANVGVNSSSIIYVFLILSSIFLPHPLMSIFGLKWTLVISQIPLVSSDMN